MSDSRIARRRSRRDVEVVSLSFLDVISCGFGAIILLLVLSKFFEPINLELRTEALQGVIADLQRELEQIRGDTTVYNRDLDSVREQLSIERIRLARLQGDLSDVKGQYAATDFDSSVAKILEGQLALAQQELSEEQKRLASLQRQKGGLDTVGGIPLDSEYIIFVIDTSGSMKQFAWNVMQRTMSEVLDVYPRVKGIQVMNDNGRYLLSNTRGKWMRDSPTQRRIILNSIARWNSGSNSSPVEGINKAITDFYDPEKNISIYVLGDEFTGGSIQKVLDTVARKNRVGFGGGTKRVRIHAIGFPTVLVGVNARSTGDRFARLMRALCEDNNGTFVALDSIDY